ncbi:MAG: phosphoribosylglycinamide formyltransferase [Planctomycetota bacterium]|nr:phosphoribosylglycinamide formyltransferase [Planctomycetota bacterium]
MSAEPASIGFLLSGGGRSLENLHQAIEQRSIAASIDLVIASRPKASGLERATRLGIPHQVHRCKEPQSAHQIFESLDAAGCQWVLLGGWLRKLEIPARWLGKVLNIHPSLLPLHGGKGCYGDHVHQRVLDAGESFSGCSVHFVDDHYDHGPVILQQRVPVLAEDTIENLAQRVFEAEKIAYPQALEMVLSGEVKFERR